MRDLAPVSLTSWGQLLLVANPATKIDSLKALVERAKARPGALNYGSPGAGTPHHLAMELLKNRAKISLTHISYRGTAPAVTDLLGGQIDLMFLPIHVALQHVKAGKLKALAISSDKPSPLLPDTPSLRSLNVGDLNIGGLTAYGTLLGPHSYDWLQRDLVKPYYYTANERLPQYATEAVLRQRAAELPAIQTLYGWEAESLTQDDDRVSVAIAERGGAGRRVLRAAYAVGCDGSRSLVRKQAGITQTRTDHDCMMVLLVFRSRELHTLLERYPGKSYYNVLQPELKGYWKFFGRVDLGNTWFFHAPVPPDTTKDNFDFKAYLQDAVGAPFDVEFEHIGFWDLRFMLADSYRKGRVFVAGDAAHSHPPYGGYGVNSGLEDARNLGWKLAAALQGWGGQRLLDSYDEERRPVFQSTIRDFIAKSIETDHAFLDEFDPERDAAAFEQAWKARATGAVGEVHAFEPNYEGSSVVWPGVGEGRACSAVGSHRFEARAGHHLPPASLPSGRNSFETMGAGYTLFAFGTSAEAVQNFRDAASGMKLPLTVVVEPSGGEADRYDARWILVRPDQFVSWVGQEAQVSAAGARKVLALSQG